jgi:arylsulfatase A-like enzyme
VREISTPETGAIHAETRFRKAKAACIVEDGYKLIWHRQTDRLEFFDLQNDPSETPNLHSAQIERASDLKARLKDQARERQESAIATPAAKLSPEEIEQLRTLGYLP